MPSKIYPSQLIAPQNILDFDDLSWEAYTVFGSLQNDGPASPYAVSAVLESLGYHDRYAQEHGYPNLFALSERIVTLQAIYAHSHDSATAPPSERLTIFRNILRGILYPLPWVINFALLFLIGLGLWGESTNSVPMATGTALGIYSGIIFSSFWAQMAARRIPFFMSQHAQHSKRQSINELLLWGTASSIGLFSLLGFLLRILGWFDVDTIALLVRFGLILAILQVVTSPLYSLRQLIRITVAYLGGFVTLVGAALLGTHGHPDRLDIRQLVNMQIVSLVVTTVIMLFQSLWVTRTQSKGYQAMPMVQPRRRTVMRELLPYGLYGWFYFGLLFVDRFIVGTVFLQRTYPAGPLAAPTLVGYWPYVYPVTYEFIINWGLLVFVPILPAVFVAGEWVSTHMIPIMGDTHCKTSTAANVLFYRPFLILMAFSLLSVVIVGFIAQRLAAQIPATAMDFPLYTEPMWLAVIAYGVLAVTLFLITFHFVFGRVGIVTWVTGLALIVDIGTGIGGSLMTGRPFAPLWGLAAGTGVLFVTLLISGLHMVHDFPAYYAARDLL